VFCSPGLLQNFEDEAIAMNILVEKRICHHLENHHALRNPSTYHKRVGTLKSQLDHLKHKSEGKRESSDMVRVAKNFGKHAINVLQTVHKEDPERCGPYEGKMYIHAT